MSHVLLALLADLHLSGRPSDITRLPAPGPVAVGPPGPLQQERGRHVPLLVADAGSAVFPAAERSGSNAAGSPH